MAAIEGGRSALACATGQAAEVTAILTLCSARRPHRLGLHALRRHAHAAAREPEEARHRDDVRRSGRAGELQASDQEKHQAALRRDPRQPAHQHRRHRGAGEDRARGRDSAGARQHRALALPVPADRMGRRHRGALGDQVHRRPRHHHGRRDRRVGQVQLGQRQVPRVHHALARLPRRHLPRDLRRLRLHHEGAHGDHAHLRPGAVAAQRLAAAAGPGVAARAHGPPLRQRARGGRSSCKATRRSPG